MLQMLPDVSSEIQMAISGSVKSIMEKKIIPVDTFVQTFLHSILTGTENQHSQVADAWVDCLIEVIPFLPLSVLHKEVYPVAIQKTMHDKPVHSRISSCKILGALCKKYPCQELKRDLLPVVLSLCQDVNADVRASIAYQLPHVIHPLGSDNTEKLLLPLLVDLAAEGLTKVKEAALLAVVESIPFLSPDTLKSIVLPLLKQLMTYSLEASNTLLLAVAKSYGKILVGVEKIVLSSEKEFYVKFYEHLLEKSIDRRNPSKSPLKNIELNDQVSRLPMALAMDCRKYCAYNYAAIVKFASNDNNRIHLDLLHGLLVKLMGDSFIETRKAIASSIYDIIIAYGKYKLILKPQVTNLINDDSEEVLEGIVPNLSNILLEFARSGAYRLDQMNPGNSLILQALEHCELALVKSHNWRLYSAYIQQMEVLFYFCPTEILYSKFLELYYQRIFQRRVLPLRLAFIRTILVNMKYSQKASQQSDLLKKITDMSCSPNFYDRMLFIRTCDIILDVYSTNYFKEHFFLMVLKMKDDPVPNIRWGLCKLLPTLTNMISLPAEQKLKSMVDETIEKLKNDKDIEVKLTIRKVLIELESPNPNIVIEDHKKFKEERKLAYLDSALIQTFPMVLEPSVDGVKRIGQPINSQGAYSSKVQQGFTDKEFLVDAGIALPKQTYKKTVSPIMSHCDNIENKSEETLAKRNFYKKTDEVMVNRNFSNIPKGIVVSGNIYNKEDDKSMRNRNFSPNVETVENGNTEKNPKEINRNNSQMMDGVITIGVESNAEINKNVEEAVGRDCQTKESDAKNSPRKKQLLRQSIPIRKKTNTVDSLTTKIPEIPERRIKQQNSAKGKRHSLQVLESDKEHDTEIKLFEGRSLQNVNNFEKCHSLNMVTSDPHTFEASSIEKRGSVQGTESSKRHSLEIVDMNKNLTGSKTNNASCESNSVQRRKKSQLPRPLSCVVLPVRNIALEKSNTTSKLPVMRRP